ncbi:hypothetical protein MKW92_000719 [Papaver armeniacum]|nr:hypothetical protein MKW92_000719 [Papaver armeniacum]
MLTGRESLVRLIGKRRKILPDRQSFLLTPPENPLDQNLNLLFSFSFFRVIKDEIREDVDHRRRQRDGVEICESSKKMDVVEVGKSDSSYVTCPVCGVSEELSRKLKQPTLFQFSLKLSTFKRIKDLILPKDEKVGANAVTKLPVIEDNYDAQCVLPLNSFAKLETRDTVSFVRDQYNVKDPNAIKKVVGYIRELARYLSPLIEKNCLVFEGLTVGWEDVLHVVECAKNFIPGKRKVPAEFSSLIQEVMKSHQHLFIDEEKILHSCVFFPTESFKSLSDDSQNLLFDFLLERPWFRNEVLDVLTVSELRDIWSSLSHPAKGIYSSRKQELISLLSASYDDGKCLNSTVFVVLLLLSYVARLPSMVLDRTGIVFRLFFLNGEQDLNAFYQVDLGLVKYPAYNCIRDDHVKVKSCIEISDARISSSREVFSLLYSLQGLFIHLSDSYIYSKVVTLGISYLERERSGRRGYWTLRLSVDLEHLLPEGEPSVAEEGLLDPWEFRSVRRWPVWRQELALQYYANEGGGWYGVHTGEGIWMTIFGFIM